MPVAEAVVIILLYLTFFAIFLSLLRHWSRLFAGDRHKVLEIIGIKSDNH